MTVFDLDALVLKNRLLTALTALRYRKSDRLQWPVRFLQGDSFVELPSGATISVGIKRTRADTAYLALATNPAKTGSGGTATYTFDLNLNTEPVVAALSTSDTIECFLEVEVVTDAQRLTSQAVQLTLERDIIVGGTAPAPVLAALGGGGFVIKQSSFTAEPGKAYLVGVGPNSTGGSSVEGDSGEGESAGGYGSIGSAETEIIITLPANPRPADAIVVLDAFGNWSPTNFGQSAIPVFIRPNGKPLNGSDLALHWLPCSSILTFSNNAAGWRITRIETGRHLDLGYNSTLDLCNQYPDGVMLHNSRGEAYPRFIVRHATGANVSLGMLPSGNPIIEPGDNRTLRIGQFPLAIRAAAFELLNGHQINVPIHNPSSADMAVFRGMDNWSDPNLLAPGTLYYEKADGKVKMVVQNPRPLTITLTGTTHNWYAGQTFDLNGNYGWKYSATSSGPAATFAAPVYQHPAINGAQIRFANNRWALYVDNVEYAYCDVWGSPVYPIGYNWLLKATNEGTDFSISWDESIKRWIPLDNSAP